MIRHRPGRAAPRVELAGRRARFRHARYRIALELHDVVAVTLDERERAIAAITTKAVIRGWGFPVSLPKEEKI